MIYTLRLLSACMYVSLFYRQTELSSIRPTVFKKCHIDLSNDESVNGLAARTLPSGKLLLLHIRGGRGKRRFQEIDLRSCVRTEDGEYPMPGSPAVDAAAAAANLRDPVLQHLQNITVELDPDTIQGRQLLSVAPVPRIVDSDGESMEAELLFQTPLVVADPAGCAELYKPEVVARRLWQAAEVPLSSAYFPPYIAFRLAGRDVA